jgi:cytochrome c biogenesis protein CcdA/thiol-disulfide isomerase/thioredoxin
MTNILDIGLAFLEGLGLIISPCIFPVLPFLLGASVDGGKKRPLGIVFGFVLMFTIFVYFSRQILAALGISPEILKWVSAILLAIFGVILMSEKLSAWFNRATSQFANTGNKLDQLSINTKEGFFDGVVIGALIGLVWTPCAGPILGAVLVQIIRQTSDASAMLLIAAFSLGAAVPMLIISLLGRKAMTKLSFIQPHIQNIRRLFGVLIIISSFLVVYNASSFSFFKKDNSTQTSSLNPATKGLKNPVAQPYKAPEFVGIQEWLNSKPLKMADLKGKVVLIDFWTYSCINCVRTLPYLTKWDKTYRDKGLVIIGIHAPEFDFERNVNNVKSAMREHNIQYPVPLDSNLDTWQAFKNRYWPAKYLIDQEGNVVYTHFGEGQYDVTEQNIQYLLGLNKNGSKQDVIADTELEVIQSPQQTPETYLGYVRLENMLNEGKGLDLTLKYKMPPYLPKHFWALDGQWKLEPDRSVAKEKGAKLALKFFSKKVFLVMGSGHDKPVRVSVKLNKKEIAKSPITVDRHTLFELIDQDAFKEGLLEITALDPELEVYAFTFGN